MRYQLEDGLGVGAEVEAVLESTLWLSLRGAKWHGNTNFRCARNDDLKLLKPKPKTNSALVQAIAREIKCYE